MAGVLNSGKFDSKNTGEAYGYSVVEYSYCKEATVSALTHPNITETKQDLKNGSIQANDNTHDFGFIANNIIIHNESNSDLAFSFACLWGIAGDTKDSIIVKANSTQVIREPKTAGIKARLRAGVGSHNYIIQAF